MNMSDCENFASIYEFAIQMFQDFSHLVVWQSIEEYKKITLHIIYFILNITLHLQLAHQPPFTVTLQLEITIRCHYTDAQI